MPEYFPQHSQLCWGQQNARWAGCPAVYLGCPLIVFQQPLLLHDTGPLLGHSRVPRNHVNSLDV